MQFNGIAAGSAAELKTQLLLTEDIFEIHASEEIARLEYIQKMLSALRKN
ncbi:hypothetical protein KBC77_01030 [Candidatus Saccharibacteria bacterium]|nr:hypothetical protein [Candidatus Saccharibacteria bacterium]